MQIMKRQDVNHARLVCSILTNCRINVNHVMGRVNTLKQPQENAVYADLVSMMLIMLNASNVK